MLKTIRQRGASLATMALLSLCLLVGLAHGASPVLDAVVERGELQGADRKRRMRRAVARCGPLFV